MARALIFSDTHLNTSLALNIIKFEDSKKSIDKIIHLGDMVGDAIVLQNKYKNIPFECVSGNCDFDSNVRLDKILELENKKIFITHGHKYKVKESLQNLRRISEFYKRKFNIEVVLFGHTHKTYQEKINNLIYFNPGAVGDYQTERTYGIIQIKNNNITFKICKVNNIVI